MSDDDAIRPPHTPRVREHVGMIRWQRTGDGDWTPETARGQYLGSDGQRWRVRLYSGIELDYDLQEWAPFQ